MLSKKNRITKTKEIDQEIKKGKSSFDDLLGVKCLAAEDKINRFVIVVSAKVSKKAVERNKIKRRLSEIIRLKLPQLDKSLNCFVLALPQAREANYHEIEKSLLQHFKRLKMLK